IIGKDGKRTRWGVWAPEYLNGPWRAQRGLNSLEILSHLKSAHHITGDDRYGDAYRDLIENHGYAENARHVKLTLPGHVNHSDDELAFISYYPLLKYETDEGLRSIYLESLEESWQEERPERNPWWNYIYGAVTENACDVEEAARTLREIPLDLIDWPIRNSHRADIRLDADRGRKGELQSIGVLPYDELPALKWNANPYALDGGGNATREDDGTYFLLPYWMGRYYGFLEDTHS
ncbi:TPA: transcriptional regulator, partial [Candidatus Latescibacteria bacterium]|nr:transcriptional regulator [Candidatus Latescibacterota bacterium]